MPDEKLGVYVFGNYDHAEVRHVLMYKTLDWFALGETRDWNAEFKILYAKVGEEGRKKREVFEAGKVLNTTPSLALTEYIGKYVSPLYGETEVRVDGKMLFFNVNNVLNATLPHWHFDTFYGPYQKLSTGRAIAKFCLNTRGRIDALIFNGMEFRRLSP